MIKLQEHLKKIEEIKEHIRNSKGQQQKQYIKCLHRLEKQTQMYYFYSKKGSKEREVV